jgi:hypothetical protein
MIAERRVGLEIIVSSGLSNQVSRSIELGHPTGGISHGVGVVANRAFGEVAQPEVFLHALA